MGESSREFFKKKNRNILDALKWVIILLQRSENVVRFQFVFKDQSPQTALEFLIFALK